MSISDSINPNDTTVLQTLKKQEKVGEHGFLVYYRGDEKTGSELIKQAYDTSTEEAKTLQNSYLREHTEHLLNDMHTAIQNYINQPSNDNLHTLKSEADNYKIFLSRY